MKTLSDALRQYLEGKGLSADQAGAVLKSFGDRRPDAAMIARSDDPADGYSTRAIATLTLALDIEAVRWIDANCPGHWARGLFEVTA